MKKVFVTTTMLFFMVSIAFSLQAFIDVKAEVADGYGCLYVYSNEGMNTFIILGSNPLKDVLLKSGDILVPVPYPVPSVLESKNPAYFKDGDIFINNKKVDLSRFAYSGVESAYLQKKSTKNGTVYYILKE